MSNVVEIYKFVNISSSHRLNLPYESKCNQLHGHNYKVEMWISGELDEYGMVIDFHKLKAVIYELDHVNLNDKLDVPTTAENMAIHFANKIHELNPDRLQTIKVRVWETETAYAEFKL